MSWNMENTNCVKDECPELEIECNILLSDKVRHQIRTLLKAYPELEWIAALVGKAKNGDFMVEELRLVDQKVTGTTTLATKDGNKELAKMKDIIGWIHSHNEMKAEMSDFDWDTSEMYPLGMVVNNDFEFDALVKKKVTCGREAIVQAEVNMHVDFEEDKNLIEEAKKLIQEEEVATVKYKRKSSNGNAFEEDYDVCSSCDQKVGAANLTYCDTCGYAMHKTCHKRNGGRCAICIRTSVAPIHRAGSVPINDPNMMDETDMDYMWSNT